MQLLSIVFLRDDIEVQHYFSLLIDIFPGKNVVKNTYEEILLPGYKTILYSTMSIVIIFFNVINKMRSLCRIFLASQTSRVFPKNKLAKPIRTYKVCIDNVL